jgi:hypothetical protein
VVGNAADWVPSKEYAEFLRSPKWTELKRRVFERAGGVCERCHIGQAVHCHHVTKERFGGGERLEDLVAVCRICHLNSQRWFRENNKRRIREKNKAAESPRLEKELRGKKRRAIGWVRTQAHERRAAVVEFCGEKLARQVEVAYNLAVARLEQLNTDSFAPKTPLALGCRDDVVFHLIHRYKWHQKEAMTAAALRVPLSKKRAPRNG